MITIYETERIVDLLRRENGNRAHLQMYIVQNIGRNPSIDNALGISDNVEWIGNEVACGLGMQRIDIMVSKSDGPLDRVVMPIESYLSIKLQTDDNSLVFTNISY